MAVTEVNPFARFVIEPEETNTPEVNPFARFVVDTELPQPAPAEPEDRMAGLEKGKYSEKDLVDDKYFGIVKDYMENRYNLDDDVSRKDITRMFMNNMRGFSAGNSVRAIKEVSYLNSLNEKQLGKVGEAYTLFEGMANIYSDETTLGEKAGGTWDYIRSTLADPINVVGFGAGKAITAGTVKGGTYTAQKLAMRAYHRTLAKEVAKEGMTKVAAEVVAKKAADKIYGQAIVKVSKSEASKIAARRAIANAAPGSVAGALVKREALKEIGLVATVDSVAGAMGTYAYEKSLVRTDVKEEVSKFAVGMGAIGGMVMGGVAAGLIARKASKGRLGNEALGIKPFELPTEIDFNKGASLDNLTDMFGFTIKPKTEIVRKRTDDVEGVINKNAETFQVIGMEGKDIRITDGTRFSSKAVKKPGQLKSKLVSPKDFRIKSNGADVVNSGKLYDWGTNVRKGVELDGQDNEFFRVLMLGDAEKGLTGFAQMMSDKGFVYRPRTRDDTITRFMTDAIMSSGKKDTADFIKQFKASTGIKKVNVEKVLDPKKTGKLEDLNIENFAQVFAKKISDHAVGLNSMAQAKKILALGDGDEVTFKQYADAMLSLGIKSPEEKSNVAKFMEIWGSAAIRRNQNRIIRLLVSNPSTSYLNLVGWGAATGINSITDMGVASIHFGRSGLYKVFGNDLAATEQKRIAGQLVRANRERIANLFDPNMTLDTFRSISILEPKALQQLTEVLPGGIEDVSKMSRGFDPNNVMMGGKDLSAGADKTVDFIQKISFVKAQDVFTKSQEFMYQMDKNLRVSFDKSFSEFYTDGAANKMMATEAYQQSLAKAVAETQRATFSKSYKDVGMIADIIEEARNVAGLGLLVPFGRFFNNTVNFMVEMTGGSLVTKGLAGAYKDKGYAELLTRGAVGWASVTTLAQYELDYRKQGLAWDQSRSNITGEVTTEKFIFPISHLKAGARIMSYFLDGEQIPEGEMGQIAETIGLSAITRQLNQTADGLGDAFKAAASGDKKALLLFQDIGAKIGSQAISGATRFLDPVNLAVGLGRGNDYTAIDRRDGSRMLNDSVRYMDQMIAVFNGEDLAPQRVRAVTGEDRSDASKMLGSREIKLTDTAKIMNMIGKPTFQADMSMGDSGSAKASNRFNQLFNAFVEFQSTKLLKNPKFKKGEATLERKVDSGLLTTRLTMVQNLLNNARASTLSAMEAGTKDDPTFKKMIDVMTKYSAKKVDLAMRSLSESTEIGLKYEELSLQQLNLLESYLDSRREIKKNL